MPEGLLSKLRHRRGAVARAKAGAAFRLWAAYRCYLSLLCRMPSLPMALWWRALGHGVITIGQLLGMAAHLEGKGHRHTKSPVGLAQRVGPPGAMSRLRTDLKRFTPRGWAWLRPI